MLALLGKEVGYLNEQDKRFPVVIRLDDDERQDIETINNLPVPIFAILLCHLKI